MKNVQLVVLFGVVLALLFGCAGGGPAAPGGVSAKGVPTGVQISWAASTSSGVVGYNIYRSNVAGQDGGKLNGAVVNDLSYTDANVQDSQTYYYTVKSVDAKNAEGAGSTQASITAHTMPPSSLSLSINGGTQYATSTSVTLSTSATGATECQFSNDGVAWGTWQPYATTVQWNLQGADGQKTVYMECRNSAGVVSVVTSATIMLKTTGPDIAIVSPRQSDTLPTRFSLSFTVMNALGEATCNANADGTVIPIGAVVEGEANTLSILLPDGGHELYVQCTDNVGTSKSQTVKFETEQNPVKVTINDGSGHTASTAVNLNIFADGAARCRFSNDGSSYSAWMPYAPVAQWTLSSGNGMKMVYVDCQNSNNVSLGVVNDSIMLDNNPPSISLTINNGESVTYTPTVKLYIYASSPVTQCRISDDGGTTFGSWLSYNNVIWYNLQPISGVHLVIAQCKNAAGSQSSASSSITLQLAPPEPPMALNIQINGGSSRTMSTDVNLGLSARFAQTCRYRNEVGSWTDWQPFVSSRSWTLSSGQGSKTVFYQCMNQYGTSGTTQAQIVYGSGAPPTVNMGAPVSGQVYSDETVPISFIPDGGFPPFNCAYYCNGVSRSVGSVAAGSTITRTLLYIGMDMQTECGVPQPGSQFTAYVVCTDGAGTPVQSQVATFQWTQWVGPLT